MTPEQEIEALNEILEGDGYPQCACGSFALKITEAPRYTYDYEHGDDPGPSHCSCLKCGREWFD